MKKDIYYITARNLLRWSPEQRRQIVDRLASPYERECVRQAFVQITARQRHFDLMELNMLVDLLIASKGQAIPKQAAAK